MVSTSVYSDDKQIIEILNFWFGVLDGDWSAESRDSFWWFEDKQVDAEITKRFGELHELAIHGELNHWATNPMGRLALIIVLDQFSRNIHRRTPSAFAGDTLALTLVKTGLQLDHPSALRLIERVFFFAPLMHAEDLSSQEQSLFYYEQIYDLAEESGKDKARKYVHAAQLHREIIIQFSRFPHRNAVLGRTSTVNEDAYLSQEHESFGQA